MDFWFRLFIALFWFFSYNGFITILGLIFVRFRWSHRFGLRCLAMGYVPSSFVASSCRLDCSSCKCGNWTCSRYHSR